MNSTVSINQSGDCDCLIGIFNQLFAVSENTVLVKGGEEPVYLPADAEFACHRIIFTRDYFSSALHECAHWCVAGKERRQQEDYGYWYAPDGRSAAEQSLFERVEVKPQALEWIFHVACKRRFRVSADNLEAGLGASKAFKQAIYAQVQAYCRNGLGERPLQFTMALAGFYGVKNPLQASLYRYEAL